MTTANLTRNQLRVVICLGLTLMTAVLYWPLMHHDFVNLDDQAYITANPHVQSGLTGPGIAWAFRSGYAANWHPLTWLSHMLDCQLYDVSPAGHHLTNLLFHIANTLLLFVWLNQLTQAVWRSALVAALFAWHPMHVESVAWAAERKDVLSAFFWMLTLLAYTRYARCVTSDEWRVTGTETVAPAPASSPATRHPSLYYTLALFFFACGLMSKPMVVTLPFVLLLLDFWPIQRLVLHSRGDGGFNRSTIPQLLLEKLPFFALALAGSAVTYLVQKGGGAVWLSELSLPTRMANALVSYLRYLSKTFWPVDLAVVYPYPRHWPAAMVAVAVLVLAFGTGLSLWRARRNPYWLVGWLWFLGTLVPTIGIVQVGSQSMADRYLYLPSIGLFLAIAWGLNDFSKLLPQGRKIVTLAGMAALAGCLVVARIQLDFWPDSITLLRHAIAVTTDNYVADNFLGRALDDAGKTDESLPCYIESVRIEPHFPEAQYNLGMALLKRGWPEKAGECLAAAVKLTPDNPGAHYSLGLALAGAGKRDDATIQFTETLRLDPGYADAHNQLALICLQQSKTNDVITHFFEVVRLQPDNSEARFNLGLALLDHHQPAAAAVQFAGELRLAPDATKAHYRLAQALQQQNQPAEAVRHYREALRLTPEFPEAKRELDEILAAHPELK